MAMLLTLTAITPFVLLFVLMVVFKKPTIIAAPIVLFFTVLGTRFVWGMETEWLGAAFSRGILISLDIALIVFGAIFLLSVLRQAGVFSVKESFIAGISRDKRIQAIIIGWFFVSFIEGIAGFGTPAILAAPLLVVLGFSPMCAVIIALVGDSVAVTFGAVGVPITIGIAQGVSEIHLSMFPELVKSVAFGSALIHLIIGFTIPLVISVLATFIHNRSIRQGFSAWPFALMSGFAFLIPFVLSSFFLSPEFPSIVGALVGGFVMIILAKKNIFTPKHVLEFSDDSTEQNIKPSMDVTAGRALKAFTPYLVILFLLVISRIPSIGIKDFLRQFDFSINNIFGTTIGYSLPIIYSPGFVFLLVGIISLFIFRLDKNSFHKALNFASKRIVTPLIGLVFILGIVQILIYSSENTNGLESIPIYLAQLLSKTGLMWPFFAPFIGALGAFMTGSSTVSNLLFASFQAETAIAYGFSLVLILSLQAVGSALGNMIAIHNILAAQAAVGLKHLEGKILHYTLIPLTALVLFAGIVGILASVLNI